MCSHPVPSKDLPSHPTYVCENRLLIRRMCERAFNTIMFPSAKVVKIKVFPRIHLTASKCSLHPDKTLHIIRIFIARAVNVQFVVKVENCVLL